eukprot:TRINITY_DN2065_c0_g1_i1.p1 TRINITY_DN2065_c0_g1~~TRINITY_DN2065_c0_g1_i1.p1  ORF type:complete len:219 (-),score=28.84 TRINITY_DN2065_c0_g1_i1:64-720(-)
MSRVPRITHVLCAEWTTEEARMSLRSLLRLRAASTSSQCRCRVLSTTSGSASGDVRPFQVLGIQQVSVAGPPNARYQLRHFWGDLMELGSFTNEYQSSHENVHSEVLPLAPKTRSRTVLSLITPLDPTKKPSVQARALHHVGLWIDDLPKAVEWLQGKGVNFILDRDTSRVIRSPGPMGHDVAFISPKKSANSPISGCGVLIQLVQAPLDMLEDYGKL